MIGIHDAGNQESWHQR